MLCKNNINYLWLNTIQQQPVPKAGGDLELSVGYVREKMAERHRRVLIILLEYQWNRKRNSSAALRQGYFCSTEADAHFLCCSPKTMQEKKKNQPSASSYLYLCVFPTLTVKLPSLTSPHIFWKGLYSLLPHRAWPASPHPPLSLSTIITAAFLYCHFCGLCRDKEVPSVTLLGCAKLKKSPRTNRTVGANLTVTLCFFFFLWSAEQVQNVGILCRPLQQRESMSQEYIKIVPMSHYKSQRHGFPSTHFLI